MKFMGLENGRVFKLHKTIYGLKESSMEWYKDIKATIIALGYVQPSYDACLFTYGDPANGDFSIIIVYVDDILCFSNCKDLWIKACDVMHSKYGLDDCGTLNSTVAWSSRNITTRAAGPSATRNMWNKL